MKEKLSASLKTISSLKIGGQADIYYPENRSELIGLLERFDHPIVIGAGSNCVFEDVYYQRPIICTVLQNKSEQFKAQAGVKLATLFDFAVATPATVGGAVANNFGAFGLEIFDFLAEVEFYDIKSKSIQTKSAQNISHGYRHSWFRDNKNFVILSATFKQIRPKDNLAEFVAQRKSKQPLGLANAGSLFKNPEGNYAGKLIEASGLKGVTIGDLQLWQNHANIVINKQAATYQDFVQLVNLVTQKVQIDHAIKLEPEIEIIKNI